MKTFLNLLSLIILLCLIAFSSFAQANKDSSIILKTIQLDSFVVKSGLDINAFIKRVEDDTSFYKAFKNLHILTYSAHNYISIYDKDGTVKASLSSITHQQVRNGCRTMQTLEERHTGNFYDRHNDYNYYTAQLYANLFFTKGKVCGETNIVKDGGESNSGKGSMEKRKEQLKILIFDPGKRVPGIPIVGSKVAIFDDDMAKYYDFFIRSVTYRGFPCYVFGARTKPDEKDNVVIDSLITYFRKNNFDIVYRQYSLSYHTLVFDFDVNIKVRMGEFKDYLVPLRIDYKGNWNIMFKKREIADFTAEFFNIHEGD